MFCLQNYIQIWIWQKTKMLIKKKVLFWPSLTSWFWSDVSFCQKDWEELTAKATNDTASVLQFIPTTFSSTSVTTPMTSWPPTVWDIVSNLNLHVKKSFYEQLSKHRDNKIIKDIYLLTSKQSTSTTWFSFREGVITASVVHEFLPKLNSKTPLHKNKASINLCVKICGYQKKSKKSKSLEWGTSKEKIARKRYVRKNKSSHINFQCQESGLFISQAYPYSGASTDGVISCNCCGEGILEIKCHWTSRERLISEYIKQPESCLTYDDSNKISLKNSHPYMQQIQHQMFVTGRLYCDFEVF